jgi:hypothetical protein
MAILTASQLQTRGIFLARGVLGIIILWVTGRVAFHYLRSPVQCSLPQPVAHSSIDARKAPAIPQEPANEGDERMLRCDAGYVIDGFQPYDVARMTCRNAGAGGVSGEWQCSAGVDTDMEDSAWPCAARACVEVSHCNPLPDTVDTGCDHSSH